jgi:MoaA/NifB/PqqE/SkfB family radical SAM enzyme
MFSLNTFLSRKIIYKNFFSGLDILKEGARFSSSFLLGQGGHPLSFSLMLTSACNNNCQMCFERENLNKKGGHLELSTIKKLVSQAKNKKILVLLTGGEPFLHPQIWEVIQLFNNKNIHLSICTNGTSFNDDAVTKLSKTNIDSIIFSLHGGEEKHDKITGRRGNFKKAVANIKNLKKQNPELPILINYALTPSNITDMECVLKVCEDMDVTALRFQHMNFITRSEAKESYKNLGGKNCGLNQMIADNVNIDTSFLSDEIDRIKKIKSKINTVFVPDLNREEIKNWYSKSFSTKRKCFFIFRDAFIDCNGDVSPCRTIRCKLGNIKEDSLEDIFNSPQAKNFRKKIKKGLLPACARCCKL